MGGRLMGFELQVQPLHGKLTEAFDGAAVELRELPWIAVREAMSAGGERGFAGEGLLAASLHVDGKPVGIDALLQMPGRYTGALGVALMAVHRMHGLIGDEPEEDDEGGDGDDVPKKH
jgi:hypothetical protein